MHFDFRGFLKVEDHCCPKWTGFLIWASEISGTYPLENRILEFRLCRAGEAVQDPAGEGHFGKTHALEAAHRRKNAVTY
jgi:hypothetical protein